MLNILLAIVVSATLDSTTVFLGDQVNLNLQAVTAPNEIVQMPVYGETLIPEVEIVKRSAIDTTRLNDGRLQLQQRLTLTSFKDSLFYIQPIPFVTGNDTIFSNPLSLNVIQPFEIDSALSITPIKNIWQPQGLTKMILRWLLIALLAIALIMLAIWLIVKYGHRLIRPEEEPQPAPVPLRPAEEVALEQLDLIKQQKIWQQGRTKDYHTQLTDVVREYIGRRFEVRSTEKTSDETLQAMKTLLQQSDQKDLYLSLQQMLRLADLVKFAKWQATPEENERSLSQAYSFVKETTPEREMTIDN